MPPTKTDEGIGLAAELRRTDPEIGVVILGEPAEPLYGTMLPEGARGDLRRALHEIAKAGATLRSPSSWDQVGSGRWSGSLKNGP